LLQSTSVIRYAKDGDDMGSEATFAEFEIGDVNVFLTENETQLACAGCHDEMENRRAIIICDSTKGNEGSVALCFNCFSLVKQGQVLALAALEAA
jgi:hypothetical protein